MPQPPQLAPSVLVGTHCPPQNENPVAQTQLPPTQLWPVPHPFPQLPQLSESVYVLVQVPPQSVMLAPQLQLLLVQVPPAQP